MDNWEKVSLELESEMHDGGGWGKFEVYMWRERGGRSLGMGGKGFCMGEGEVEEDVVWEKGVDGV